MQMLFHQPESQIKAIRHLVTLGCDWAECARLLRVNQSTVAKRAKRAGINKPRKANDPDVIRRLVTEGKNQEEIAKELRCSAPLIQLRMREYGIKAAARKAALSDADAETIKQLVASGCKEIEIGEMYNVTQPYVSRFLVSRGIPSSSGRPYTL